MSKLLQQYEALASATLEKAQSLPFKVYQDPSVYDLEAERIFSEDWVFVCSEHELPEAGDYFALTLAGESIAIIRGKDEQLRVLSNNCRHRGTPLLDEGFGKVEKNIVCPYHAWTYDDQGKLKGVPFPGSTPVDKSTHCLPEFHLDTWLGLVFINLSERPVPLAERLSGIDEYMAVYEPEKFQHGSESKMEHWQANWKLAMENAMESYHLFKVHKETLETVTPSKESFYVAGCTEWTLTAGKIKDSTSKFMKWLAGEYPEAYDHYMLISLPPSMVAIMDYDSLSWLCILPENAEQSVIRSGFMTKKSYGREDKASKSFTEAFFAEDKWICERVQQGMKSRKGKGGKLVDMERVVVDFHQYLACRMFQQHREDFFESEKAATFKVE
ncbi:aromatic ring-hydroxylating oxygenase subunit alpha [Endozoicomonas arenosclerae]|uniref:aromatic ring-hydroxylating oxygenase subunit alpha n=1 Tax=Endozoicomonas arenosclerae TaxID=1633495 RepID=UPI000780CC4B|nr:aromatic ring-hydroxylating dioxygenase subunit alpha [Endozoicomonas arenosclerae]